MTAAAAAAAAAAAPRPRAPPVPVPMYTPPKLRGAAAALSRTGLRLGRLEQAFREEARKVGRVLAAASAPHAVPQAAAALCFVAAAAAVPNVVA